MGNSSIILFGTLFSLLLIFSCIIFNAPQFYTEIAMQEDSASQNLVIKPKIKLRDRNTY